jgi:small subunit ribosomal protein S1
LEKVILMTSDQETIGAEEVSSGENEGQETQPVDAPQEDELTGVAGQEKLAIEVATDERPPDAVDEAHDSLSAGASSEEALEETEHDVSHPMDALLDAESYELEIPRRGEIRIGTIARVTESDVLVDVGAKSEGVISTRELERLTEEQRAELTVGKKIDVYVVRSGGRDGTIVLSVVKAEEEQDWRQAEELLGNQDLFEGVVAGYNKGGLIVKLGQLRGFVPASQVSISRRRRAQGESPDQRWGKMVDEPIMAKVIEVDRRRNRLILSERAAAREARDALKEKLITDLQPGEIRSGHVISLAEFGAFIDIGGADGLVHKSEISWKRISHPRDVLRIGQKVQVKVLGVDSDRKRISLSLRELEADPWVSVVERYKEGQLVEGTITKLTKFGAFASLVGTEEYDIEGLIHVSELSDRRIEHPREVVEEGQTLALRIIKVDLKQRRIGLSLKRVDSAEYADQDWQTAIQDIETLEEEGIGIVAALDVEDFDAALEAEASESGDSETEVEEVSESGDSETEVEEVSESGDSETEVEEVSEPAEVSEALDISIEDQEAESTVAEAADEVEIQESLNENEQAEAPDEETLSSEGELPDDPEPELKDSGGGENESE